MAKNPHAVQLGRKGGRAKTPKQAAARRQNLAGVGRPRRVCVVCGEPVIGGHVDRDLDATCGAHGWHWQKRGSVSAPDDPATLRHSIDALERTLAELRIRLLAAETGTR